MRCPALGTYHRVRNMGSTPVPLEQVTVQYWFQGPDSVTGQAASGNAVLVTCSDATASIGGYGRVCAALAG